MALIATYGSVDADSYVADVTEAMAIANLFAAIPFFGVDTSGFDALVEASSPNTSAIEMLLRLGALRVDALNHQGEKLSDEQARAYPRIDLPLKGAEYASDAATAPSVIKQAQVMEACVLSSELRSAEQGAVGQRIVASERFGQKSVSYINASDVSATQSLLQSQRASTSVEQFLRSVGLLRGRVTSIETPRA